MELTVRLFANGAAITGGGASTSLAIRRGSDGFYLDFNDSTFKSTAWGARTSVMTENALDLGWYHKTIATTGWTDGIYLGFFNYTGSPALSDVFIVSIINQVEVDVGLAGYVDDIGTAGAGLTALGDTRIANLDATVSSRTKPADTQAAVTLVATTTNLTNAPTSGDLTAAMKASVTAAVPTVTQIRQEMDTNSTQFAAIVADTNELQTDWHNGGRLDLLLDSVGAGAGSVAWSYTVTDSGTGLPIADVDLWITTDLAGTNIIASGKTNTSGIKIFYPDVAAGTTLYVFRQKAGIDFDNPDVESM